MSCSRCICCACCHAVIDVRSAACSFVCANCGKPAAAAKPRSWLKHSCCQGCKLLQCLPKAPTRHVIALPINGRISPASPQPGTTTADTDTVNVTAELCRNIGRRQFRSGIVAAAAAAAIVSIRPSSSADTPCCLLLALRVLLDLHAASSANLQMMHTPGNTTSHVSHHMTEI